MSEFHSPCTVPVLDLGELPLAPESLTVERVKRLPAPAKVELQALLDELSAKVELARKTFHAALDELYGEQARTQLHEAGKDTGTVHLSDGPLSLTVEIRKTVIWTQTGPDGLAAIAQRIADGGDDPAEYIDIKYAVSERKFESWPETLKAPFRKARTVKPGKPTFRLQLNGEER